jgi:L-rhamnose-H+ transport protein
MIHSNPIWGTGLHAIGGMSASSCYTPHSRIKNWSWGTFWLVQAFFAWVFIPLLAGWLTVPGFFDILHNAPDNVLWGFCIRGLLWFWRYVVWFCHQTHWVFANLYNCHWHFGSAGHVDPVVSLWWSERLFYPSRERNYYNRYGFVGGRSGFMWLAGFKKENDLGRLENHTVRFNMTTGLFLAIIAGVLSAVFNLSLEHGQPIADMAAKNGAGNFEGNAKMIVSTSGCFAVNFIWFIVLGIRQRTLKEFTVSENRPCALLVKNTLWSALAGTLWFVQFLFYGLGHVQMGNYRFISWVLHMSMLIFFSYIVGVVMKEWKQVSKDTNRTLVLPWLR